MKRSANIAVFCAIGLLLFLCVACEARGERDQVVEPEETVHEPEFNYAERMGQTAVLTEDAVLEDAYSYTYKDPEDYSTYMWLDIGEERTLRSGDIVLVLADANGMSRVMIPYGDIPWLYGYVASDLLSSEFEEGRVGNQAIVTECSLYDAIDGNVIENYSGKVRIHSVYGEWSEVTKHSGGDDMIYWVHLDDLSFDFGAVVLDLAD